MQLNKDNRNWNLKPEKPILGSINPDLQLSTQSCPLVEMLSTARTSKAHKEPKWVTFKLLSMYAVECWMSSISLWDSLEVLVVLMETVEMVRVPRSHREKKKIIGYLPTWLKLHILLMHYVKFETLLTF